MIIHSENSEKQYELLRENYTTSDLLSVQDVIDMLQNLELPKEKTLKDIPFGVINIDDIVTIFIGTSKENRLLYSVQKAMPILLNFKENIGIIISDKDDLYKELKLLKKENSSLKDKLNSIKNKIKDITNYE